ncbi:hypothetical protein CCZ01_05360 [Helicobacter monodelphidis]|uniref:ATP-grasp domain-containing protein n=1 Tax=Helicobacter sp. 15-1451 TaxID=2004995 RepID=UPI000DCD2A93|nr:hypothetical protein [Helicobacter sp. 15-1451]RAX57714.1 hypothetical protein CCZ01_05360 [Helicobacter sp. 15-1451]
MMETITILTCNAYKEGNQGLKQFCAYLQAKGLNARLLAWQECQFESLNSSSILLALAMWDYSLELDSFLEFLTTVKKSRAQILNPIVLLEWNLSKQYLLELHSKNIPIIPSILLMPGEEQWEDSILRQQHIWGDLVIKPLIGQSGKNVCLLTSTDNPTNLKRQYPQGAILQPFIQEIKQGEMCLIFFENRFQYAICRKPAAKDWRANSAYGVDISLCQAPESAIKQALKILENLPTIPLYTRVDVIAYQDRFLVNEVELIEPSLYFDLHSSAIEQFTQVLLKRLR